MCGIAGFWAAGGCAAEPSYAILRRMTDALWHRGPDDAGHWCDEGPGIALGHRRLSIIDLSPQGHQPMISADGRWTIVFNGEIYNYPELRRCLETAGVGGWRGSSDTEVLLAAVSRWGLNETLNRLVGMFGFALWDGHERCLYLARDRMGEKPLYYGWLGEDLLFGSELKALRAHPGWKGEIDRDVLALFMRYSYLPAPHAIYQGFHKLRPGHYLRITSAAMASREADPVAFWSHDAAARAAQADRFSGSPAEAVSRLDALMRNAVAGQMVADVPVGAFLSGGIDSSAVVALMQAQDTRQVRTFTIGFTESEFNEANYARKVAAHLGTDHTELFVTPRDMLDVIPRLPVIYDEPFGDSSQVPTILVSRLARSEVTVCLSGDGGDELFGGYRRYDQAVRQWLRLEQLPTPVRRALAALVPVVNLRTAKLREVIGARNRTELYRRLVSNCRDPLGLVLGSSAAQTRLSDPSCSTIMEDYRDEMMWLDAVGYLPGDILAKMDRASMSVSLESRIPLLDHRIVEFAWSLPAALKWHDGRGKWPLRALLAQYVPSELIDRPKKGFGIPVARWLRDELRDWAENQLSPTNLRDGGWLNVDLVRQRWKAHVEGKEDRSACLWNILMFQIWLAEQK